ncbi:site-specific integrase [Streptomyces sp. NBC_01288]|uniref:tyrosine-type recombinase/integrase n=1 Tax=Streptomyces sp. NBC_01288 TaxID=2903814 RepID=UPI002E128671|nr:site-specific integrase [Streptomyces sp. NBC_01288]
MARRGANGDGTVSPRKDGRWEAKAYVLTTNGLQKRVSVYGATRAEAKAKLSELKAQEAKGIPTPNRTWLLGDYLDYWLAEVVKPNRRPATYAQCEQITRLYLKPGLGSRSIQKLSVPLLQTYVNKQLADGHSIAKVHIIKKVLSSALTRAQREELITRNVAHLVELPAIQSVEVQPWAVSEAARFLEATQLHRLYPAFLLLLLYGLRRGEVLGLRWRDIDFERSELRIRQQLQRVGRNLIQGPVKTKAGNRNLPLVGPLIQALQDHHAEQKARSIQSELVFTTLAGTPIEPRNFVRSFQAICKQYGLRIIKVHALRHTAATMLKDLGIPARDAQIILGHARITTTQELYQHGDSSTNRNALERMESALIPEKPIQRESSRTLATVFDNSGCRQLSRQTRKNPTRWLDSFPGAGTGTLTLDLILGKTIQNGVTERKIEVDRALMDCRRRLMLGIVVVNLVVKDDGDMEAERVA